MYTAKENAKKIIRQKKGIIRTTDALKAGIHPRTLYALRDEGVLEQFSRGVYRLADAPLLSSPDLQTIAIKVPQAVICLISALSFHGLTTQIPHNINIAVKRGSRPPHINYPPISVFNYSKASFNSGIEKHEIDGITLRIYNQEKTLADCFKFRETVGMDVVLEAMKLYKQQHNFKIDALMQYATICRVKNIMTPYLEVLV